MGAADELAEHAIVLGEAWSRSGFVAAHVLGIVVDPCRDAVPLFSPLASSHHRRPSSSSHQLCCPDEWRKNINTLCTEDTAEAWSFIRCE